MHESALPIQVRLLLKFIFFPQTFNLIYISLLNIPCFGAKIVYIGPIDLAKRAKDTQKIKIKKKIKIPRVTDEG